MSSNNGGGVTDAELGEMAAHTNPYEELKLDMDQVNPEYGLPAQLDAAMSTLFDMILAGVSYYFGIIHQNDLSKTVGYRASIVAIFALVVGLAEILEYLKHHLSRGLFERPWPAQILAKIIMVSVAYSTGLIVRVFTNAVSELPKKGSFGFTSLYMPLNVIILAILFIYYPQMKQNSRNGVAAVLRSMARPPPS